MKISKLEYTSFHAEMNILNSRSSNKKHSLNTWKRANRETSWVYEKIHQNYKKM